MSYTESDVYNEDLFFEQYMKRRHRTDNPNDSIEKPVLLQLLGHIKDKDILDLGCGDAQFGVELLQKGCQSYTGIEGSHRMYEEAQKQLQHTNGIVHLLNLKDYTYPSSTFDIVTSRLVLHYIEHIDNTFKQIFQTLKPGGTFAFSVQHPVITSAFESLQSTGQLNNTSYLYRKLVLRLLVYEKQHQSCSIFKVRKNIYVGCVSLCFYYFRVQSKKAMVIHRLFTLFFYLLINRLRKYASSLSLRDTKRCTE
ncbi:class I SAM-dependent DNA methyltransferase [Bacillus sp. WLY-B-L8]|uniref:class I SAM-dependent DNA methyltransferase n=1 Tax=Bacillus multifaciens TaxID=3068506 RepID=UPI0027423A53|nr:class I SAM-dependent methyltransferase [Bacillus sp. WLY-B-L8]MDP7979781.1 class I SAM-dependent methyltransferase [Bacillus sp. WLY-B-L8]